jgi:signal transduction histidine kinase
VWFAPMDGGLRLLREDREERITEAGLGDDVVYSIAGAPDGVWVGRQRGGLTHLHFQDGALAAENYTSANGLAPGGVYSVYQARNGAVWAGTLNSGLSVLAKGRFTTFTSADGLASNTVTSILQAADGTMWFGTPDGLRLLSNGQWRQFRVKDGLPSDEVNCLEEDSRGVIWIGTSEGLAFLQAGQIESANRFSDALRDQIFGLVADRTGWLWVVSARRVVRVNRDRLLRGVVNDGDVLGYGMADGLRSVQGAKRDKSIVLGPLGKVWISTNNGLSVTDPTQPANTAPTIVQIVSISADNNPLDPHGPIKVPTPPKRLSFAYSGVSLRNPERVRFRYRLEGYDDNWSQPTSANDATYTRLRPGNYRFRVTASNPDGVWNTAEASVAFKIIPLYWQTWWFRLALVGIFALGAIPLYRVRLHRLTAQMNLRFEERLEERTRIAQELHDTLLQGFLSACMRLDVALDTLPDGSTAKNSLVPVLALMRRVVDEGRNAVSALRSDADIGPDLPQLFSRMPDELALSGDVEFRVIVEGYQRRLNPILRDDVYRICREALVNTVRHSSAKNIEVEFNYTRKQLRVLVRDDGCGIDPHVLQSGRAGHWGLPGMRERTERIGGKLRVRSSPSAGTEVELALPGHVAFESNPITLFEKWRSTWNR